MHDVPLSPSTDKTDKLPSSETGQGFGLGHARAVNSLLPAPTNCSNATRGVTEIMPGIQVRWCRCRSEDSWYVAVAGIERAVAIITKVSPGHYIVCDMIRRKMMMNLEASKSLDGLSWSTKGAATAVAVGIAVAAQRHRNGRIEILSMRWTRLRAVLALVGDEHDLGRRIKSVLSNVRDRLWALSPEACDALVSEV